MMDSTVHQHDIEASSPELATLIARMSKEGIQSSLAHAILNDDLTQYVVGQLLDVIDGVRNENEILSRSKARAETQLISAMKKRSAPTIGGSPDDEERRPRKMTGAVTCRYDSDNYRPEPYPREIRRLPSRTSSSSLGASVPPTPVLFTSTGHFERTSITCSS